MVEIGEVYNFVTVVTSDYRTRSAKTPGAK